MDTYFESNRNLWDAWTRLHVKSKFYDVEGFKSGRNSLDAIERQALGDVSGKSLLHLQCHFGMDTLSWARLGARVTGVDFSPEAIAAARALTAELGLDARFVESNIYEVREVLSETFDIVFTSYGALYWLPDMWKWAQVVSACLKPGGTFFVVDGHPFAQVFENEGNVTDYQVHYQYFHSDEPLRFETHGSYADPFADIHNVEYGWQHSVSDIVNALLQAGLRIRELGEYPFCTWQMFAFTEEREKGRWYAPSHMIQLPLLLSIKATKP